MTALPHSRYTKAEVALYWALPLLFALVTLALYLLMPKYSDDWWYSFYLYDWLEGLTDKFPWDGIEQTFKQHRIEDNARLSNLLTVIAMALPPWIAKTLLAASVFGYTAIAMKICRLTPRNLMLVMLLVFLFTFVLPWSDFMYTVCFSFNYMFTSLFVLLVLWAFLRPATIRRTAIGMGASFILGFMHEGIAANFMAVLGLAWLCFPALRTRRNFIMVLCMLPGLLFLMSAPGFWAQAALMSQFKLRITVSVVKLQWPFCIYLLLTAIRAWKRGGRKVWFSPLNFIVIVGSIISILIMIKMPRAPRVSWLALLLPCLGIVSMLRQMLPKRGAANSLPSLLVGGALLVVFCIHYGYVIAYTAEMNREHKQIHQALRRDYLAPVYAETRTFERMSLWSWTKPQIDWSGAQRFAVSSYYSRKPIREEPFVRIIPKPLEHMSPSEGSLMPGTAKVRVIDNYYFMRSDEPFPFGIILRGQVGPFTKKIFFFALEFTDRDGSLWLWIIPESYYFPSFFLDIKRLDTL